MEKVTKINYNMESLYIISTIVIFLIIVVVSIWFAKKGNKTPEPIEYPKMKGAYKPIEHELWNVINKERMNKGLHSLQLDDVASLACESHMSKCIRYQRISHDGVQERFSDLREMLYVKSLGEIVVYGHKSVESLLESLKKSPKHNKIIFGNYERLGMYITSDKKSKMYVGMIFMK